jgi:amino acid adenylation domain-containing protein
MTTLPLDIAELSPEQRALLELRLNQKITSAGPDHIQRRQDRRAPFPLSFAQQALWLAHQLYSGASGIISGGLRLVGRFDRNAFEKSLNEIVRRHEVLRTRFLVVEDHPAQYIEPFTSLEIPFSDLRNLPEPERKRLVLKLAEEDVHRPFDLGHDSPIRLQLIRMGDEEHVLLLSMHHIVSDGWSLNVFFAELQALYSDFSAGRNPELPELPIQYGDFAVWQHQWLRNTAMLENKLSYWRRHLANTSVLELPFDRPRPATQTFRGARTSFTVAAELAADLKALSEQEGTTLFMTVLAAFQTLLSRYSGQDDVAIGTSTAGRNRVEVEKLIGCFLNILVLRTRLDGNPSFRELLQRVRQNTLQAYDHQDVPFEKLVEALQPSRAATYTPFFQVTFELHHQRTAGSGFSGLTVLPLENTEEIKNNLAKYDLSLVLSDTNETLAGFFLYNTDLFDAATIDRVIAHFKVLLGSIVANPELPVSQLPLLTHEERHWYVSEANNKSADIPVPYFHELFEVQAQRTPNASAVQHKDRTLSYRELNERANQLGHFLRTRGVGPESLVGVFMHRSPEMMVAILGILKSGGAYVPLDPTYPLDRLNFMATDSRVDIILTEKSLTDVLGVKGIEEIALDADWEQMISHGPAENLAIPGHPLNLAYVIYTSGSTGRPKGVMISHLGITNYVQWAADAYQAANGQGAVVHSPIGFDMTLTGLFPPLIVGTSVELLPEAPGIEQLEQKLREQQGFSVIKITPAHLELLNRQLPPQLLHGRTNTLVVGADALSAPAIALWRRHAEGTRIFNEYGPTETVVGCAEYVISGRTPASGAVPIGVPITNMQMYVLDPELEPVPVGVQGELYIGGFGVARGYLNRPDLTAQRFVPDPFSRKPGARLYRTGDACRYIADRTGHIEFLGRLDYQVKLRGFRIELGEIEAALLRHPAVRETVVVERKDQADDKRLVAYLVTRLSQPGLVGEVRDFLKQQLPEYMVPAAFVMMDSLSLTPNGKVDRKALPAPQERSDVAEITTPPQDAIETKLVEMWEAILDVRPIGTNDNFFEIGGHSLLAERLMAQIRREFGQTLRISAFFQQPTIKQVAGLLRKSEAHPNSSPLTALKATGHLPPFFCVHSLSGDAAIFAKLANAMPVHRPFYAFHTSHPSELGNQSPSIEAMAKIYVDAMIAAQKEGPYHLGGYSFGCVIAFEMARQLRARGLQVGLLALIDGISPLAVQNMDERGDAITLAGIVRDWARMDGIPLSLPHDEIRSLSPEAGLDYILAKVKAANLLGPEQDIAWVRRFLKGIAARTQAIRSYSPHIYDGVITLFRSKESDQENAKALIEAGMDVLSPERGWDKLTSQPIEIHFIPGHHATLLQVPQVQYLAQELGSCLDVRTAVG